MKKIAIILLSILVAGMFIACNQDVTIDAQTYANMEVGTFVLNGNNYATLQAAIDALSTPKAVSGNEPGVIYLTKDASGPGAVIDGVAGVKIDFGPNTYSFTNVTATQGSTAGTFGLTVKGGAKVTLAGTKAMNLFDNTSGLTMVYVEGAGTSLAVEKAPEMSVADDQFVFWAANGATLTIGGETKVAGGIAATGTTAIPKVIVTESAELDVPKMETKNAQVLVNTSGDTKVAEISATDTVVVVTGTGAVSVETAGTTSNLNIQNLSGNGVSLADETLAPNFQVTVNDGKGEGIDTAETDAAEKIITDLPIFESGKGTKDNPYIIKTAAQLEMFRDSVNLGGKHYDGEFIKLDADITISGVWTPIGNSYRKQSDGPVFRGNFDGDGHTITGLTNEGFTGFACNSENEYVYGLFGVVENATIVNLNLADVYIEEPDGLIGDNVGALIGYGAYNLYVENCHVLGGSIEGTDAVGGLVGRAYGKNGGLIGIEDCSNAATVTGVKKTGGIGGYLHPTNLSKDADAHGILGIVDCKNTGSVTSEKQGAAGIACFSFNKNYCDVVVIQDNTNTGAVFNGSNMVASIAYNSGEDDSDHSDFDETGHLDTYKFVGNSNTGSVIEGTVLVTKYRQQAIGGTKYKEFNNTSNMYDGGNGLTAETPYQIASEATLKGFRDRVNIGVNYSGMFFVLTDDITLTEAWTPIGNGYRYDVEVTKIFKGTFDGNKHTISGLTDEGYVPDPASETDVKEYTYGLFGYVDGGTIKNVTLTDVSITGSDKLENGGGIVGYLHDGTVTDCSVSGSIGGFNGIAGIVGRAYGESTISGCTSSATITGVKNVGGVVGFINPSRNTGDESDHIRITKCTYSGTATRNGNNGGNNNAGGLGGICCYGVGPGGAGTGDGKITVSDCTLAEGAILTDTLKDHDKYCKLTANSPKTLTNVSVQSENVPKPSIIPDTWYKYTTMAVDGNTKRQAT